MNRSGHAIALFSVAALLCAAGPAWSAGDDDDWKAARKASCTELKEAWVNTLAAERKAEADLRLQRALRVPDPTVSLQYEHEQPDKPNTIGLAVSLPLPLWNRNEGNITAARTAISAAKVQTDKLRAQIAADIASARVAYEEAAGRWQRYREQIRPKSEQIGRAHI